ncbi:MAG: hypothetical protein AB7V22_11470 [Kiritimatiellia bacterium]
MQTAKAGNFGSQRLRNGGWTVAGLAALCLAGAGALEPARAAVLAEDDGANYGAGWANGSNGGTGFGAWQFILDGGTDAAVGIGDPAAAGIAGMATNAFFLSGTTGYANARRAFATPLKVGDVFHLQWGNNFDTGGGFKGLNLYSGVNQILNLNMGASQTINVQGQPMFTNYGTAAVTLNFEYVATTNLRVHATGRDGSETFDQTFAVSGAPDAFLVFAGNLADADLASRIPYVDQLRIEGELVPELAVAGREGMAAGQTNQLVVSRTGPTDDPLTVDLHSDAAGIAAFGAATATIPAGETQVAADLVGVGRGSATLTLSAAGFTDVQADVEVYDLAYDSSSCYAPGGWTNESNGGAGFGAWVLENNDGDAGAGVTNYAGAFLGDSTIYGGGDVNVPAGNAFALYANSSAPGSPYSAATRLLTTFPEGGQLSFDLGVNYRNGSKGAALQWGATWLFEVAVRNEEYVYADWGAGDVGYTPLGWSYTADTAIRVVVTRYPDDRYTVALDRTGGIQDYLLIETEWKDLGGWAPDRIRFDVRETENAGANNFYFNRLGLNQFKVLDMEAAVNVDVGGTTTVYLRRSDVAGPLTVDLSSASDAVATVPASVTFADGEAVTNFTATGVSESLVDLFAEADGYACAPLMLNVFPFPAEWDDAGNYVPGRFVPTTFVDGADGGGGFGPWAFSTPGTAVIDMESFVVPEVWFDSVHDRSFRLLGGTGELDYAEARRALDVPLAAGDTFQVMLGVDWSGGYRGIDVLDDEDLLLFNLNLSDGDVYTYAFGANPGIELGWAYDGHSAILVEVEQLVNDQLSVTLTRNDGSTTNVFSDDLAAPAAKLVFYNGGHDGDSRQALFVNDLAIVRDDGAGPPVRDVEVAIVDVGGVDYLRATVDMGVGELGAVYTLEYTTDLAADPVVWTEADSATGDGVAVILLQDDNETDPLRIYRVRVVYPAG